MQEAAKILGIFPNPSKATIRNSPAKLKRKLKQKPKPKEGGLTDPSKKRLLSSLQTRKLFPIERVSPLMITPFIVCRKKQLQERYEPKQKTETVLMPIEEKVDIKAKTFYPPSPIKQKTKLKEPVSKKPSIVFTPLEDWKLEHGISLETKVFTMDKNYPAVKAALLARNWVENPDSKSMCFDLKWSKKSRVPDRLGDWQIINHFERNFEICTKANLGGNLLKLVGLLNINPRSFYPRCYRVNEKAPEEFLSTFKAIFAASMLKAHISGEKEYPLEELMGAVVVCNRWAYDLEQKKEDCERQSPLVLNLEWRLITSESAEEIQYLYEKILVPNRPSSEGEMLEAVTGTLNRLKPVDEQFSLNGHRNIWIVKPGLSSRGRNIKLFETLEQILETTENAKEPWVIQKYIENPLIIKNKKFDIREWVLVTNADPLVLYIYKDSYLRFSVEDWDISQIRNNFIHLTNNAIEKHSKKFSDSEIEGCMWHLETFKEYLLENYGRDVWNDEIFPRFKKIVKWSVQSIGRIGYRKQNSFELMGYDFMIDENLRPWLLEINSCPSMDYSTSVTESLVEQVMTDTIKIVVDKSGDFGKFECVPVAPIRPKKKMNIF